ncbi:unnamed protein product [Camellia sinensis]
MRMAFAFLWHCLCSHVQTAPVTMGSLQSDTGSEVGSLPLISSIDGLGKLQSVEGMTIQNAFELMDRAKPIQNLLKDVATNVEMWNAFVNNKEVKECLWQLETGANNVVTYLSSNQQTDNNLSSLQWSSGANNIVRTPSIDPQTHNGFFSQQQSSAMEASTSSEVKFQILANSHIPLSISSGDEVESAISRFTSLGKLQSVKGMTIQKAFGLDGAEPIQEEEKLVPINGRGKTSSDPRFRSIPGEDIPHRPAGQRPETAPPPAPDANYFRQEQDGILGGFMPRGAANYFRQEQDGILGVFMPRGAARVGNFTLSAAFGGLIPSFNLQNVVKAVATYEEMRNVFLNITEVQEFKRQLMTSSQVHIFINEI